jgi:predicted Rossmann fold nucleotide-binding protein DprA/Smf involved in DNA uptake
MLHVAGGVERLLTLAEGPVVAIAGASRASDYGLAVASSLARDLAASGVTVASLLCDGIATAAQSGALNARAGTMAVLGGGLDRGFPARKRALYGRVLEYGCVVAELPGAERGRRWGPIAAERVLAGLADAMVVVESTSDPSLMSGVVTARALERVVAAVPGRVTSPLSGGTNALLAGGAPLVRDAADVLELLSCPPLRSGCETGTSAGDPTAGLPGRLRAILEAVGAGRDTPDQLSRGGGNPGEVLLALSELELLGLLVRGDGGRYLPSGAIGRVRSQAQADRPSERCRADADGEAEDDVDGGDRRRALPGQALGLEHPRREGRVGAESGASGEQEPLAAGAETVEQSEQKRAGGVDGEGAEGKAAAAGGEDRVEQEAGDRPERSEDGDPDPDPGAHELITTARPPRRRAGSPSSRR